jgi:hypothetical protein
MADDNVSLHLDALKRYSQAYTAGGANHSERTVKQAQLLAIQKTIGELEKRGIPVPEGLDAERISLASAVDSMEDTDAASATVYEALLDIVAELGVACGRRPHRDLRLRFMRWRSQMTAADTLRTAIVETLKDLGGSGSRSEILVKIEGRLREKLTPADRELNRSGRCPWKVNAHREIRHMLKEGVLVLDTRRGTLQLVK